MQYNLTLCIACTAIQWTRARARAIPAHLTIDYRECSADKRVRIINVIQYRQSRETNMMTRLFRGGGRNVFKHGGTVKCVRKISVNVTCLDGPRRISVVGISYISYTDIIICENDDGFRTSTVSYTAYCAYNI